MPDARDGGRALGADRAAARRRRGTSSSSSTSRRASRRRPDVLEHDRRDPGHGQERTRSSCSARTSTPGTAAPARPTTAPASAVAMEAVRILKALGVKPRRTIRIALWSGEEQGLLGSRAYVIAALRLAPGARTDPKEQEELPRSCAGRPGPLTVKPEHAKLSAYFNLDNGTGKIRGDLRAGERGRRADLRGLARAAEGPRRDDRDDAQHRAAPTTSPSTPSGCPGFQFIQDEIEYETRTHHTNMDVYERLQKDDLMQASVVMATFVYKAAMRDGDDAAQADAEGRAATGADAGARPQAGAGGSPPIRLRFPRGPAAGNREDAFAVLLAALLSSPRRWPRPASPARSAPPEKTAAAGDHRGRPARRTSASSPRTCWRAAVRPRAGTCSPRQYIQAQMEALGLKPGAPGGGWIQKVPLVGIDGERPAEAGRSARKRGSSLTASRSTTSSRSPGRRSRRRRSRTPRSSSSATASSRPSTSGTTTRTSDLKGKVLLMMNNDPEDDPKLFAGKTRLWYGRWDYKYLIAAQKGAVGAIIIHTHALGRLPVAGRPELLVAASSFELPDDGEPRVEIKGWFDRGRLAEDRDARRQGPRRAACRGRRRGLPAGAARRRLLAARSRTRCRPKESGQRHREDPGQRPAARRARPSIYTAHHDHLGDEAGPASRARTRSTTARSTTRPGVAAILAIARAFAAAAEAARAAPSTSRRRRPRSRGCSAREYLAKHPPVRPGRIAANINIDGVNIFGRTRDITLVGLGKSSLDPIVVALAKSRAASVKPDQFPDRGFFYRSDQFNLAKVGVPAAYFDSGTDVIGKPAGWGKEQDRGVRGEGLPPAFRRAARRLGLLRRGRGRPARLLLGVQGRQRRTGCRTWNRATSSRRRARRRWRPSGRRSHEAAPGSPARRHRPSFRRRRARTLRARAGSTSDSKEGSPTRRGTRRISSTTAGTAARCWSGILRSSRWACASTARTTGSTVSTRGGGQRRGPRGHGERRRRASARSF